MDPTPILIDIGCNLGSLTLKAAALGRKVIAVDGNIENTKRLIRSVEVNNFTSLVTVVTNIISDRRNERNFMAIPDGNSGAAVPITYKNFVLFVLINQTACTLQNTINFV